MKKRLLFTLLILLLLLPFIVKAELRETKLIKQYNTGYSNIYYMGDYFLLTYGIYKENSSDNYLFATMDYEGNYIYEEEGEAYFSKIFFDNEYLYELYTEQQTDRTYNMKIVKYNPKTGEKISNTTIPNVDSFGYNYSFNNYKDYIGIDSHGPSGTDYILKKDLSGYQIVTNFDNYNEIQSYNPPINYLSKTQSKNFYDYLKNNNINEDTLSFKSLLIGNQYYTFTKSSNMNEVVPNIIYADKNLTDYELLSVNNKDLYDGTKVSSDHLLINDIIPYNDKLVVVFTFGGECILAHDASNRFGNNCVNDSYVQIYNTSYVIATKTDGNGEIKVSTNIADSGTGVTFEIIPKEGYVLSEVKVTDSEGNVVTFTDYKFTMPSADVTIEAKFAIVSPKTGYLISTTVILTLSIALGIIVLIIHSSKKKIYKI